jgi:hypothetical protein
MLLVILILVFGFVVGTGCLLYYENKGMHVMRKCPSCGAKLIKPFIDLQAEQCVRGHVFGVPEHIAIVAERRKAALNRVRDAQRLHSALREIGEE